PRTIEFAGEPMVFFECRDFEVLAKLSDCDSLERLVIEGHCPPRSKVDTSKTHSDVPHQGRWKTRHTQRYVEYEWIPDPLAELPPVPLVPDKRRTVQIDFAGGPRATRSIGFPDTINVTLSNGVTLTKHVSESWDSFHERIRQALDLADAAEEE